MPNSNSQHTFPAFFPKACPPENAFEPQLTVHRFVEINPLGPKDFMSYKELGIPPRKQSCDCECCGLSVFTTFMAATIRLRSLKNNFPDRFKDFKYIAQGDLTNLHGRIMQTGKDTAHYTWWAFEGIIREAPFTQIEVMED